jgi:hypothetical protein
MKVVMIRWMKRYRLNCFAIPKNAKEWNLEEHQLYDGDPPQCAKSKAISI